MAIGDLARDEAEREAIEKDYGRAVRGITSQINPDNFSSGLEDFPFSQNVQDRRRETYFDRRFRGTEDMRTDFPQMAMPSRMGDLARLDEYRPSEGEPSPAELDRLINPRMPRAPAFGDVSYDRDRILPPERNPTLPPYSFEGPTSQDIGRSIGSGARSGLEGGLWMGSLLSHDPGDREYVNENTAPMYKPRTRVGEYAQEIAHVFSNPVNWAGPGGPAVKAAWNAASGVSGETARKAYEGTPYEAAARFVGGWSPMLAERVAPALWRAMPEGAAGALGGRLKQPQPEELNPRAVIGGNNPPPEFRMEANPRAPYPQYAEAYPAPGPSVMKLDKKKGTEYEAKQLTPEAEAFSKKRLKIMKEMEKEGYEPYFDVSQRYHVDPANYPANLDTKTISPAKLDTISKQMSIIGSPEARARLQEAYAHGKTMPNTNDWYAMGQLENEFVKELGPVAGRKAFQDRIATSMAATTGGATPTANWLMAQYSNYLRNRGEAPPEASHQLPYPIGGQYAAGNMRMAQKLADEGGFQALGEANPKRHNFSQNFTGNRGAATIDEVMTGLMTPGESVPAEGRYGLYEQVLAQEAKKAGVSPQEFQAVAWSGAQNVRDPKYTKGQPFMQTINESIERTHRLTGMPREEIVRRGIIRSEIPMYAVGGLTVMGALADQSRYRDEQ